MPGYPDKPRPGDRVAVLSPGTALPHPCERGLRRLREKFGLEPVEYPTTRRLGSSPADRAADVNAAFADPGIAAVLTSIGGDDQIKILRYLDPDVVRADRSVLWRERPDRPAQAWSLDRHRSPDEKAEYTGAQREAVIRAFTEYNPDAPVVCNVDIGHTDPHLVMPYGGTVTVDPAASRLTARY